MHVRSTITGIVTEISVEAGALVHAGDQLMVIESMKMEIPVESPGSGVVGSIGVTVGGTVNEGDVLAEIR